MVSTNLFSPCPITNVYSIFCDGVFPSSSGKQWRGMQISCIVLENFPDHSEGEYCMPETEMFMCQSDV